MKRANELEAIKNSNWIEKWGDDLQEIIDYHHRKNIKPKNLLPNATNEDHTDLLGQLMWDKALGLNITTLEACIKELEHSSSTHKQALRTNLLQIQAKKMGHSGVYPLFLVKCFLEPRTQGIISKGHKDKWDSPVMFGLYNIHKYNALSKVNKRYGEKDKGGTLIIGYCPVCTYATGNHGSINNHMRVHYRKVLECGMDRCSHAEMDADAMRAHGNKKHKLNLAA